jgi:hypothetical protein
MIKKVFSIFKKEETQKIIWWSTIEGLEKVAPILPAKEVIPDWWKIVERYFDDNVESKGTIKNCPSFPEFLSQGYVMPLWCDLQIDIKHDNFEWKSPDKMFNFSSHGDIQFRDFVPKHIKDNSSMVLKAECPWRLKTPKGYSVWQLPMYYHYNPIFEVLPGIIWSDIHHEVNQQMLIKKYGKFLLKRGTPLAVYVPFKREKYKLEIQGPTPENARWSNESYLHVKTKFTGGYKLNQSKQSKLIKCPFNNDKN